MKELQAFAVFAERLLAHTLTLEGVNATRSTVDGAIVINTPAILTEGQPINTVTLRRAPVSPHQFPRPGGLALWQHLRDFHDHLWPQLRDFKLTGMNIKYSRKTNDRQYLEFGAP